MMRYKLYKVTSMASLVIITLSPSSAVGPYLHSLRPLSIHLYNTKMRAFGSIPLIFAATSLVHAKAQIPGTRHAH
jgi:hypothetical protein